jgi:hypothetical protein
MNPLSLSPEITPVLGHVAHAVGDLWTIHSHLAPLATALVPDPEQDEAAQKAAAGLSDLRQALVNGLVLLHKHPTWEGDVELLELTVGDIECVLVDRIEPAIAALTESAEGSPPSAEEARTRLQCVVVDHLLPAIASLTTALQRATS